MSDFKSDYEHVKVSVDQKLAKLRQDFDMPALRRMIDKKLNKEPFQEFKASAEERLSTLDNSFLLVGQDLDTVQKVLNRMNKSIAELQDVNKDALIGKIGATCLACNNDREDPDKKHTLVGYDGKPYYGGKKTVISKMANEDAKELKNLNFKRTTPQSAVNTRRKTSVGFSHPGSRMNQSSSGSKFLKTHKTGLSSATNFEHSKKKLVRYESNRPDSSKPRISTNLPYGFKVQN